MTPLARIETEGGEVMKAMIPGVDGAPDVAEAYFSRVDPYAVRAWKLHTEMTVNVVVPYGHVRFVISTDGGYEAFDLGPDHDYARLTIGPGTWFGFQGGASGGLILNLADVAHRPNEGRGRDIEAFDYAWMTPEEPQQ